MKAESSSAATAIRSFRTQREWNAWLEKNHRLASSLWMRLAKKGSHLKTITYAEAIETALCYGWIDGQKRGENDEAWLQRFLPRAGNSVWSKINREKAVALIAGGRMKPAGLACVNAAKENGRWDAAYDSPKRASVPGDFQAALDANRSAREFFAALDGANRYAVLFRIQTVKKSETRERKIRQFIAMLERGERIHEPRGKKAK